MAAIGGVGGFRPIAATQGQGVTRAGAGGFTLGAGGAAGGPSGVAAAGLGGLLALQEGGADSVQDRAARRHGLDLLGELAGLQHDLLTGPPGPARLARLTALAGDVPAAQNERLREIVGEIALRARIEAVRYSNS